MTRHKGQVGIAIVVAVAAVALHAYVHFVKAEGEPSIWVFLWSLVPYFLCFLVFWRSDSGVPSIAGGIVALILDGLAFDEVFVHPTSSTSALLILFVPLWNTLLLVPITMLVTHFVSRWVLSRRNAL